MDYIIQGFREAFNLIFSYDPQLYKIVFLSLFVSTTASVISSIIFMPLAALLGLKRFKGEKIISKMLYTLMSTPSVIVGLMVALVLSRRGPLGFMQLLYTPSAMIIAQTILVTPFIMSLVYSLVKSRGREIEKTGMTLGASRLQIIILVMKELKMDMFIIFAAAFSRAISEVGAVMIVGGNIMGYTRVITTSIAMFNTMGDYSMAIALGIVLIIISFAVHLFFPSSILNE